MKMNFAGLLPNPNVSPENFRFNCTRNKACQKEFFIPVENLCDFMLYFDLPFMPVSYTIFVVDSCTGLELAAHVINYVVASHTQGFYAIFAGLTNSMLPPLFYIKASFFNSTNVEAVFYSNDFEIVTCEPLTRVYSCYNDAAPGTDSFDMNGVYYGVPLSGQVLGNADLRYYHFLKVRKGSVLGNKTKLSLSAFNYSKVYKGQATQQYNFFSESVPEFYKEEILAVIARGNIQINEKPYQVADEIEISLVDEDSQRWAMNVTLNKNIFNYYSCKQTICNFEPCAPVLPPAPCCDPEIISTSVEVVTGTGIEANIVFDMTLALDQTILGLTVNGVTPTRVGGTDFPFPTDTHDFKSYEVGVNQTFQINYTSTISGHKFTLIDSSGVQQCQNTNVGSNLILYFYNVVLNDTVAVQIIGEDGSC